MAQVCSYLSSFLEGNSQRTESMILSNARCGQELSGVQGENSLYKKYIKLSASFCFMLTQCIFIFFLRLHLWHMEVPRLWVKLELHLPAYTTATAIPAPSHIYELCRGLWQHWILNPLSKARDWTSSWMVVRFSTRWATMGTPQMIC